MIFAIIEEYDTYKILLIMLPVDKYISIVAKTMIGMIKVTLYTSIIEVKRRLNVLLSKNGTHINENSRINKRMHSIVELLCQDLFEKL